MTFVYLTVEMECVKGKVDQMRNLWFIKGFSRAYPSSHWPSAPDSSEVWSPLSDLSHSLPGTAEEVDRIAGDLSEAGASLSGQQCLSGEDVFNLMDYGDSHHDVEDLSEDAHDAQHTTRLHDN
ncbi:hypothetical protein MHYP_G00018790 [Metynnis hypsauchen]